MTFKDRLVLVIEPRNTGELLYDWNTVKMKWNPLWLNPKVITYLWPFKYIKYDLKHIPTHTDNLYYHTISHTVNPYYQTLSYTVRERSRETLSYFQGKKQQVINIINDNIFALVVSKFVPYVICQSVNQSLMSFVSQFIRA